MDASPSLRRIPTPDLESVAGDPQLVERIAAEIERDGPLTFARFMELALYDPEHGYYRAAVSRAGRDGDFLTAPEANPIFGRAIARHVVDTWRALGSPAGFVIREHGAGRGSLATAVLDDIAAEEPALLRTVRYRPVDIEPKRTAEVRERLAGAGHGDRLEVDDDRPIVGAVIANEVLDALPTHRVVAEPGSGGLLEIYVGWRDGTFVDVVDPPSTRALEDRLLAEGIVLQPGQRAEVCLAVDAWVTRVADGLARGTALFIDYGHPAADLYDPRRRPDGTLAAYLQHRAHGDPYRAIGRQDLTAHVDTTAVEAAAAVAGLTHLATTTQARFLAGLGAGELLVELQGGDGATLQRYLEARAALVRMIDPAAMGGFQVMAFGRDVPPDATFRGLA
jgi:SAM-dependent MidA family methyltransferase